MSDKGRAAVYAAEQNARKIFDRSADCPTIKVGGSTLAVPVERKFGDVAAVQHYVDRVLNLNWVRERYPRAATPVKVRRRKGQRFAHYEHNEIAVPTTTRATDAQWALRELVVLHEIAHHLALGHGHDRVFLETYLDLVGEIISLEAALLLRSLFYEEGVI